MGSCLAVFALPLRATFDFPARPLGRNDRDRQGFFLPAFVQAAQQKKDKNSYGRWDADPQEQTEYEGEDGIHQVSYMVRILS